jgi:hypothetical protein
LPDSTGTSGEAGASAPVFSTRPAHPNEVILVETNQPFGERAREIETASACDSIAPVVVIDSVVFAPAAWDVPGPVDVVATMSDGSTLTLFRYFPDELSFAAADFIGRTVDEVRALHHRRDVNWLES